MMILKKIWNFIKKCWYIPVGLLASLITFLVVRKNDLNDDTIFKISEDSKEKQINAIIRAEEEKKESNVVIEKEYEIAIKNIEKEYDTTNRHLNDRQRLFIERLHEKYKNDPDEIAKSIIKKFGVKYVANKKSSSDNNS
tara:strand:+ start:6237 stop:6653 length:417 start_codon:yes stop_codon:yes gene_type:complete